MGFTYEWALDKAKNEVAKGAKTGDSFELSKWGANQGLLKTYGLEYSYTGYMLNLGELFERSHEVESKAALYDIIDEILEMKQEVLEFEYHLGLIEALTSENLLVLNEENFVSLLKSMVYVESEKLIESFEIIMGMIVERLEEDFGVTYEG